MVEVPKIFLPYQGRWAGDNSPVKVVEKSRRIGWTWAQSADDTLLAAESEGMDVWYVGYNQDMAREYIEEAAKWAKTFNKGAAEVEEFLFEDEDKDILSFRIRFSSGHKITALSSRPSNLRGKQGRVVIDEAAFHHDLKELIKAALALLIWGGQVIIISTHNGEDNPFNELIEEIRAGKKPYSLHRVTLDDALADGLYQRICLVLDKEWSPATEAEWRQNLIETYGEGADEELFFIPSKGSGTFLPRTLVMSIMDDGIPVLRWACPDRFDEEPDYKRERAAADWIKENLDPVLETLSPTLKHFGGEDFGRSGDLTDIMILAETPGLVFKSAFLVELRNVPFRQQEQILFHICDRLPNFTGLAMDSRGNGQALAEYAMQRYGPGRVERIYLSQSWYLTHMTPYKVAMQDKSVILPRDADVLSDHQAIKLSRGVPKVPDNARTRGTDGKQRHGDSAIAGVLAFYAATHIEGEEDTNIMTAMPRISQAMTRGFSSGLLA